MSEAKHSVLRANERYKAASNVAFQLGTALLAASIVRVYFAGSMSWEALLWLMIAGGLMYSGWQFLGLLELEQ